MAWAPASPIDGRIGPPAASGASVVQSLPALAPMQRHSGSSTQPTARSAARCAVVAAESCVDATTSAVPPNGSRLFALRNESSIAGNGWIVSHSGRGASSGRAARASSVAPASWTDTRRSGSWSPRARHTAPSSVMQITSPAAVAPSVVGAVVDPVGSASASSSSSTLVRSSTAPAMSATATRTAPIRLPVTSAREFLHGLVQSLELEDEVVDLVGELRRVASRRR